MGQKSQWGSAKPDNWEFDKPAEKKIPLIWENPSGIKPWIFMLFFSLMCTYMVLGKNLTLSWNFASPITARGISLTYALGQRPVLSHKPEWTIWVMEECSSENRAARFGHLCCKSAGYSPAVHFTHRSWSDQPPAGEIWAGTHLSTKPVAQARRLSWKGACVKCWERYLGLFFPLCVLKENLKHILGKSGYHALTP